MVLIQFIGFGSPGTFSQSARIIPACEIKEYTLGQEHPGRVAGSDKALFCGLNPAAATFFTVEPSLSI